MTWSKLRGGLGARCEGRAAPLGAVTRLRPSEVRQADTFARLGGFRCLVPRLLGFDF
jgi:hypothetical protein